jgi:hypothetical protein
LIRDRAKWEATTCPKAKQEICVEEAAVRGANFGMK